MNWKKELKVGDKFMYSDLTHFAIVAAINNNNISFTWYYMHDGKEAGTPTLSIDHFCALNFITPITPLLESLL